MKHNDTKSRAGRFEVVFWYEHKVKIASGEFPAEEVLDWLC